MEDITDADYAHAKRVCKNLEIKHLGEYRDLYVCTLMYLRTLEKCVLLYINLILQNFFQLQD